MEMTVLRAGMLTMVQDLGRAGSRAAGVPVGGAADPFALRVANLLVGNPDQAAGLECTLIGPEVRFSEDAVVAVGGADFEGAAAWKPLHVAAGQTLALGRCRRGCRGYLAVRGGLEVAPVLGSRSTCLRASFGGWQGRALRDRDRLPIGAVPADGGAGSRDAAAKCAWYIDPRVLPGYSTSAEVRVVPGAQKEEFSNTWLETIYTVSPRLDRMGMRLTGGSLERRSDRELVSSAVSPGTVQVPPDGDPIVLLADAQTIGGYPRLAHVIAVDLPVVAQLKAGDRLRFVPVSLEEAHRQWREREHALAVLREGLRVKLAAGSSLLQGILR